MKKRSDTYQRIWRVVERIPRGRVATYGQVARIAGFGNSARLVGYALHNIPPGLPLPWQRVINAKGEISFPSGSRQNAEQRGLLKAEGIRFIGDRVDLDVYAWKR
jgi:methylated-DNA-protein-cysteine methyltransferase-like protein